MLGEGARTDADALRYLASYQNAIRAIASGADPKGACERNDGISIKLSALHPRYEDAQKAVLLLFYEATRTPDSPAPRAIDVAAFKWGTRADLDPTQFPPADVGVLRKVAARVAG